jgi:acyl-CoA synthetase (AMP-forming)/AMP-acid ligase II
VALSISLLLEMAVSANPDRTAVAWSDGELTTGGLGDLAYGGAGVTTGSGAQHVAYVGASAVMLPALAFSAARASVPVKPLNYRLSAPGLRELIDRLPDPLVVADAPYLDAVAGAGRRVISSQVFLREAVSTNSVDSCPDAEQVAVVLFTSGTTSRPKAVELTHDNLTNYITQTVEFSTAGTDDAALMCMPPYHVADVGAVSNLTSSRTCPPHRRKPVVNAVPFLREESVRGPRRRMPPPGPVGRSAVVVVGTVARVAGRHE